MKTTRPTLFAALLLLLAVFHSSTSQAQTRVALNIDGGGGRLHTVVIELDERNAPKTSANFKKLASEGFYKGIAFHRVVPNYLVQIGDPLTKDPKKKNLWGTGGPGYTVPAETGQKHVRGSVAMARLSDGVNPSRASNGSQFYVCLADIPSLNGDYTVFGKVVSGLDHLDRISLAAADTNNNPAARIQVTGTRIEGDPNAAIASTTQPRVKAPTAAAPATTLAAADTASKPAMPAPTPAPEAAPAPTPAPAPAAMPKPVPSPSAAPKPAPAAVASSDSSTKATPGSALAATLAAAAGSKPKPAAPAPASTAASAPVGAPPAASGTAAAAAGASLPKNRPSASDGTSADLTQPSLADDMNADRPEGSPEPKKKEGLFTRILKRVW